MDVRNCKTCGRLFNFLSGPQMCPSCKEKLEDKFHQVRDYLEERPNTPISTIAEDNEVSIKQLKQWIREERLTFSENSPIGIECESCGKMIRTGRFCDECRNKLANTLKESVKKPEQEFVKKKMTDKNKMRFLDQ